MKKSVLFCCLVIFVLANPIFARDNYQLRVTDKTKYVDQFYEKDLQGQEKIHIFLGGQRIVSIEDEDEYFFANDHLGSPTIVTNQNGQIVEENDYDDYGKIINQNTEGSDYKFIGKELDAETDLQYFGARYYNSLVGKFVSIDPLILENAEIFLADPQQLNSYAYGRDNPIRFLDPTGEANSDFQPYYSNNSSYSYGEPLGSYRNVVVRSHGAENIYTNDYQCVSFVKDFAQSQYGANLNYTGNANAYGNQTAIENSFSRNNPNDPGRYVVYQNGGNIMPQEDDIISWTGGSVGHVGIISDIEFNEKTGEGTVYTVEQNYSRNRAIFRQNFYRSYDEEGNPSYTVEGRGGYTVQAWARYENQTLLRPRQDYVSNYSPATKAPIEYRD